MSDQVQSVSLSTATAARCLGVTQRAVQKYIKRGLLPAVTVHLVLKAYYQYRINLEDLRAFAASNDIELNEEPLADRQGEVAIFIQ